MKVLIIDGQGGQLGAQLVKSTIEKYANVEIMAIGTNATATTAMVKAGAKYSATGENPVLVALRKADVVMGPIGIVIADALRGEVTPKMAVAIGQSDTKRILIPMAKCDNIVCGVTASNISSLIESAMDELGKVISEF